MKVVLLTLFSIIAAVAQNVNVPRESLRSQRAVYKWHTNITTSTFWVGELPTARNPTPNHKSSWDTKWMQNFGGFDDPNPANRTRFYTPKAFTPKLNPFYIALPYNDVLRWDRHKPEASRVIPWFKERFTKPGRTTCKGQWVQIYNGRRSCYAQWEDCGPFFTDDYQYVFLGARPKNKLNGGAGIDVSPAVRDYLNLGSKGKVHWRFVGSAKVPNGPWLRYGSRR